MDLLLHLIKKNEVSITDIPIATITEQYLATLDLMQTLSLDVAGEFLVIAGHGDVYSDVEVRGWLQETGWRPVETKPLAGPTSLLVAEAI